MKKMRMSSLVAVVAVFAAGAVGCSSNSNNANASTASAAGESCTKTADCKSGLGCFDNICVARQTSVSDGGVVGDGGGSRDGASGGPKQLGQSCSTSTDCGAGLTCVPSAAGGLAGGLCDLASYGLTPTGKTCSGECNTAADCCELPLNAVPPFDVCGTNDGGVFGCNEIQIHQCDDLVQVFQGLGGDATLCDHSPLPGSTTATACFYYETYCNGCPSNPWTCTSNKCVYSAVCTVGTTYNALGGCPLESRAGRELSTICHGAAGAPVGDGGSCQGASCAAAADCVSQTADNGIVCHGGDCTCYQSACYFQCTKDLDCPGGYACDATNKVCTRAGCTTDAQCATQLNDARAQCKSGSCVKACTGDHDCSPSSGAVPQLGAFNGTVCSNGYCQSVTGSCTTDADCTSLGGSVNMFCIAPPATPAVVSAATN